MCPGGCGQPKAECWSAWAEDEYEATALVCHACTARQDGKPAVFHALTGGPSAERVAKYPELVIGKTTTDPPAEGAA